MTYSTTTGLGNLVSDSTQYWVLVVTGPGKYEIYPFRSAVVETEADASTWRLGRPQECVDCVSSRRFLDVDCSLVANYPFPVRGTQSNH